MSSGKVFSCLLKDRSELADRKTVHDVGPEENDDINIGPITLSRWLRIYQISRTSANPDSLLC